MQKLLKMDECKLIKHITVTKDPSVTDNEISNKIRILCCFNQTLIMIHLNNYRQIYTLDTKPVQIVEYTNMSNEYLLLVYNDSRHDLVRVWYENVTDDNDPLKNYNDNAYKL